MKGRRNNPKKGKTTEIEEYLKHLPLPPEEHAYELKMEKHLKHMLEEQKKINTQVKISSANTLFFLSI